MNFETTLAETNTQNIAATNLDDLNQTPAAADFIGKSNSINVNQSEGAKNIVNLNPVVTKTSTVPIMDPNRTFDASPLGLQSKAPAPDDILFRTRTISHSNHRPHPQALRELSAIVNGMGMGNTLNVNSSMNNTIGLGNSISSVNSLDKNFIKPEPSEEYNLFNNRTFSNSNIPIGSNNNWPWNNYINGSNKGTSFSLINKNVNNTNNNTTSGMKSENNGSSFKVQSLISNSAAASEEKEKTNSNSIATSPLASAVSTVTSTPDQSKNISTTSSLTSTPSATSTQDYSPVGLGSNTSNASATTTSSSSLHIPSLFNPNSKPFSPLINDSTKNEPSSLMHSDSDITLINSHVVTNSTNNVATNVLNGSITSPSGITAQTPLINQFSKLSLDNSKSSPSSNMYNNLFFNDSEQNNMFHGSPINNANSSQILRTNSLPLSSNTSLLISSERESDMSHLKNDIDLLIRSSQLKFEDLIKYKDKLSNPNIPVDVLNHIKKDLLIQGWYQHAYYSIRKIKDRLQDIFKLNPSVWMVDIDIYITGDIDITLYYFKLHIHTCYDLKSCIVSEWHGNRYTEISNWWASASLLFNQILLLFKLSETTMIKPIATKVHIEDKSNIIEEEIRSSKSVDETISNFKKMQVMGRKGSLINHSLNPLASNINSSSNITSPLATSSTLVDSEEVDNFNDELILSESVIPTALASSASSSVIASVPNTTPPTIPIIAGNSNIKFPYPGTNIYIRGLPINTTDESLYNLCIRWGKIISSKAIVDMRTNECKGFGFVMYETEDQAHTALSELNNLGYHVSFAKSLTHASQESYSSKLKNLEDLTSMNIYISNLPLDYDNEKLLELFSDFKVLSHRILKNPDGTSRGVGFARFGSREIAQHVIDLFNNVTLKGAKYPLQVRFADSIAQKKLKNQVATSRKRKDSMREQQQQQHSPSFTSAFKKIEDLDATSTTKSESEFEYTQNSQTF